MFWLVLLTGCTAAPGQGPAPRGLLSHRAYRRRHPEAVCSALYFKCIEIAQMSSSESPVIMTRVCLCAALRIRIQFGDAFYA